MSSLPLAIPAHRTDWEYRVTWLLWLCCALSIAFIIVVPTIPAIIFLGAILLYCALFPHRFYQAFAWNVIPWVFVAFGALSVAWSDEPMQSLRAAAQIGLSMLAALMFAQGLRAGSFILITFFAFVAANVTYLFVPSVFGSKNMVGQTLALIVLASFWLALDRSQPLLVRAIGLVAFLAAPYMLVAAESEGALLAGTLALLCSLVPLVLRPLRLATRLFLICVCAFVAIVLAAALFLLFDGVFDLILQSIGKDVSLTGRTMLWSHAVGVIADHPFGVGLQAYWNEGNVDAIRFWETFYINNHYGFHFHDLWLETGVELGLIGIVIAAATTFVVFFSVWRWALREPGPESCFFAGFVTFIVARTIGEVELYAQFSMTSMMFIAAYYYADCARGTSPLPRKIGRLPKRT
jgi:exopolysaccharide production protein ExoQ